MINLSYYTCYNITIFRCLVKDNDGNITVTETATVQFKEHFGLPFGSHYIICKIDQMQLGSYNWTKVSVIKHEPSLQQDIIDKRKAFPGVRKPPLSSHVDLD